MTAGKYNITIEQGATFTLPITISDDGVLRDLTGYTARMKIKETVDDIAVLLSLTTENGRITIAADQVTDKGELSLLVTAADTAALDFTSGVYDLEIISGSTVTRVLEGKVKLSLEVTD